MNVEIKSSTTERVLSAIGAIGMATGVFVVGFFNPVTAGFFPQCPLYQMTGLACPGCGLTRGFHALFHGDILGSLDFNALIPFYALIFGYLFLSLANTAIRGRALSWKVFKPNLMYGFFGISLIFSVVRNLPFYPFNWLYP